MLEVLEQKDGTWSFSYYLNFEVTIRPITSYGKRVSHSSEDFRAFNSTLFKATTIGFLMGMWQGFKRYRYRYSRQTACLM